MKKERIWNMGERENSENLSRTKYCDGNLKKVGQVVQTEALS